MASPLQVSGSDIKLPAIYSIANTISLKGQRQTKRRIAVQLITLNIAATCSIFTLKSSLGAITIDWMGTIEIVAFLFVATIQIDRLIQKPEQAWYDGRAVAESVKTLVWKYSVGSRPFLIEIENADSLLKERFQKIIHQMKDLKLAALFHEEDEQITPSMRSLRAQSLEVRKKAYLRRRINDQLTWYSNKAQTNQMSADKSNFILIAVTIIGFLAGLIKLINILQFNFLGFIATLIVTLFTLLHLNQHETLARAYYITTLELTTIEKIINLQDTEEKWSNFVAEAEEAISREHTLWLASYSTTIEPI